MKAVVEFSGFTRREAGLRELGDLGRAGGAVEGAVRRGVGGVGPDLDGQGRRRPATRLPRRGRPRRLRSAGSPAAVCGRPGCRDRPRWRRGHRTCRRSRRSVRRRERSSPAGWPGRVRVPPRSARREEGLELLLEHGFHLGQILAGLGGGEDEEHAAELAGQNERPDVGPRSGRRRPCAGRGGSSCRPLRTSLASERLSTDSSFTVATFPDLVDPGLRNPVLEDDPGSVRCGARAGRRSDQRRPGGDVGRSTSRPAP